MKSSNQIENEIKEDLKTVSKIKINQWKNKAMNNPDYFDTAVKIGLTNQKPYCWRCAWIISKVTMENKSMVQPYILEIINNLDNFKYDSQIGSFLKTLSICNAIEEDQMGILADYCIKIIFDTQKPSHNKYYAIQILLGIAKKYPELSREFSLVIEENLPFFTKPYLRKYGKGVLAQLR